MTDPLLQRTCELASAYLASLADRPVAQPVEVTDLMETLGGALPASGRDPASIIETLAAAADPGLVATSGGRYFGFVVGGTLPAAHAADWLVTTWDQNAGFISLSPATAAIERIVSRWVLALLGLPEQATVGFVTGCQAANFMALAAARQAIFQRSGWDVASRGLIGAPRVRVLTSAEAHGTIDRALAMLGLGADTAERIACDGEGRMEPSALAAALDAEPDAPAIVCAQAGNVNTGAFDPFDQIVPICGRHGAWLHVDGAFGLWAAACPGRRALAHGVEGADSWATDAHKWINVPYDCGLVIVRDRESLLRSSSYRGAYLVRSAERDDPCFYTPESSRRARAIPMYAALLELGSDGVAALVERSCTHAHRAAERLAAGGARILNDVVLNQVLLTFDPPDGTEPAAYVGDIIRRVQADGTCWLGGTEWHGHHALRLSVSGWRTTEDDIDRATDAILQAVGAARAERG